MVCGKFSALFFFFITSRSDRLEWYLLCRLFSNQSMNKRKKNAAVHFNSDLSEFWLLRDTRTRLDCWEVWGDRRPYNSHWHSASRALTCTCTRDECSSASISSANIFRHLHTHDTTISFRIHSQARPADTAVTAAEGNIASVLNVVWWIFKGPFPRL